MNKIIFSTLLFLGITFSTQAQKCYQDLSTKDNVTIKYKWKKSKEGKQELRVKFKNKSGSAINVDLELGFYIKGVMEEKVQLNDCLKKSFLDNWFRPIHIVGSESLSNEQLQSEDLELQVTEMNTEQIEECRETDS